MKKFIVILGLVVGLWNAVVNSQIIEDNKPQTNVVTPNIIKPDAISTSDIPKAIIEAPESVEIGDTVWLRTTGSVGNTFYWRVYPTEAQSNLTELPLFGGMDSNGQPIVHYLAHFTSKTAGTYYFIFVAVQNNKADIAEHVLINGTPNPLPNPNPDSIVVPEPHEYYKQKVIPITTLLNGPDAKKDSIELAKFYLDFANIIMRDKEIITHVRHIREANVSAGNLMFQQTGMQGKYPGLSEMLNNIVKEVLGLEDKELTNTTRQYAQDTFKAIAWACLESGKK